MDIDVNKMFLNKNKEIFKKSLEAEMERNLEALKNTTDNSVALEINKLFLFFTKYFNEIDIDYKKEELLGLLYRERKNINDLINKKIEEKKNNIKQYLLDEKNENEELTKVFIDNYYKYLKEETEKMNSDIDLDVKKEVCTIFTPNLIKKYKLESEEQNERIDSRINILFKDNIVRKIKEQSEFRDESLRNMSVESFEKYLNLNKSTVEK